VTITTVPVELPSGNLGETLEQQVQSLAGCVTQMILTNRETKQSRARKSTQHSN